VKHGNNKQVCFFNDDDYAVYLDKLKIYSRKYKVAVHSYVLIPNHVHLLMTPETEYGANQLMQSLGVIMFVILIKPMIERVPCGKGDTSQRW